ncbi:MAG: glycerol kinase GlpK [Chloroflexota bacterium]|nr:glycerol kinase GlpK [Chloroflexota bacterium]
MTDGYVLAIDQGTTGTTVLLLDHDGQVRGRAYSEFTQSYPRPGWVEHDAEEIWSVTRSVAEEALRTASLSPAELVAIGITNQRETTVLWERDSGKPIAPAIVWQDRRTAPLTDELREAGHEPEVRARTGLVLDPYFSGTKVRWLLDTAPGLRERAERGEVLFGTIDSWLVWKLTGGQVHATDYTNASRTLLYNIHDLRWDPEMLSLLQVPAALLPEVYPSSYLYGETAPDAFLGATVRIAGIAGDQHAALFGQACYDQGMVKSTYGTGSFVLMNTGHEAVRSQHGLLTTIAWGIGSESVEYALEGSIFVTGSAVQWLRDGLGIISQASETEGLARSVESSAGVYFVPALAGLGAPHWDPYARGALFGITRGTTKAHIARATLESIAFQTRDVVDVMQHDSGISLPEMRADGGAVANGFLMQFQADLLGVPVEVPEITETTAVGAAYLAGLATGFWESREDLRRRWKVDRRYEPQVGAEEREHMHSRWLQAVDRARGWERP